MRDTRMILMMLVDMGGARFWELRGPMQKRVERGWLSGSVSPWEIGKCRDALLLSPSYNHQRPSSGGSRICTLLLLVDDVGGGR